MKTVALPGGERVPVLGMGTWMMGEQADQRQAEIAALQCGTDLGMTLIDTAEMYGDGLAETLVGEAIRNRRQSVFLVSKVYPFNAGRKKLELSCEGSLRRLGVDCLDLYLLHWRGNIPLAETVEGFERLKAVGKIRYWGISNLDVRDMMELISVPGGDSFATNQVLYNLSHRGIEWDLLPWCRKKNIPVMAYSPLEQARLLWHPHLVELSGQIGVKPSQLALAWLLHQEGVIVIPKTSTSRRVEANRLALDLTLDDETLATLDALFPPPGEPRPLEML